MTARLRNAFGKGIGFETYLPIITWRRAGGHGDYCPLFPGYGFSRIPVGLISDANSIISAGGSQVGLGSVVRFAAHPAFVADEIIKEIQSRHNVSGLIDLDAEREVAENERIDNLQAGDTVEVNAGSFRGVRAIVRERRGADRVVLLFKMLGGDRPVELSAHQVVKA